MCNLKTKAKTYNSEEVDVCINTISTILENVDGGVADFAMQIFELLCSILSIETNEDL